MMNSTELTITALICVSHEKSVTGDQIKKVLTAKVNDALDQIFKEGTLTEADVDIATLMDDKITVTGKTNGEEESSPDTLHPFLLAFYTGHKANSTEEKIKALRAFFLREDTLVTTNTIEEELLALEWYVLDNHGLQ